MLVLRPERYVVAMRFASMQTFHATQDQVALAPVKTVYVKVSIKYNILFWKVQFILNILIFLNISHFLSK